MTVVISSTGLHTPPFDISNAELAESFNVFVARYNEDRAGDIAAGKLSALTPTSPEAIEASTEVKSRSVVDKAGVLDSARMVPDIPERPDEDLSVLAEMGVAAAKDALARASRAAGDVDMVICACSNLQRPYPAIAIEIQNALGVEGFAYDMNVAGASAVFAIQNAADAVRAGHVRSVLVVVPELCSGHVNWRDGETHAVFGDAAAALLVEHSEMAPKGAWAILGVKLATQFSNAIRNNFGFLNRAAPEWMNHADKLLMQQSRKTHKELPPLVSDLLLAHLAELQLDPSEVRRLWLRQSHPAINRTIASRVFGREATAEECPSVVERYGDTGAAGAVIAYHHHADDLKAGDKGVLCSFGAGYAIGSVIIAKSA